MQKTIIYIGIIAFFCCSCGKDFLDQHPTSDLTSGNFYESQADMEKAVSGVYAGMKDWPATIYFYLSEVRTNNFTAVFHDAQRDWYDLATYNVTSETGTVHDAWEELYQMINRANEVLERIDAIPFEDPSLKTQYKAETRFLRAFAYFQLVRLFGRVPLVTKVITPAEGIKIKQSEPADIYQFITSEMSAVMDSLPPVYDDASKGRATKWAVKGVLAKVYLTMAGYPLHQADKLNDAKTLLKEIMDQEGSYITFAPDYADMFTYENDNKYAIFSIQFVSGGVDEGNTMVSQLYPNDLSTSIAQYAPLYSATRLALSDDLLNSYDPADKRFSATIDTTYPTNANPPAIGHTPYFSKFMDPGLTLVDRYDWPQNFPLLRYADVLLMYADVLNEQAGAPPLEALNILNRIRGRAGLIPVTPLTKEAFRQALEEEWRHEFADEGQYWFELVRTERAVPVMNAYFQATGQNIQIDKNDLLYPIPQTEMDIFPGLYQQNDGY